MGFWSRLLGKKDAKFDPFAVDGDGDGKVQDGTIWERSVDLTVDLDATLKKAEELLKEVAPEHTLKLSAEAETARKRQEAAKKAAATRAANKAKTRVQQVMADAERMAEATARAQSKKTTPKKK